MMWKVKIFDKNCELKKIIFRIQVTVGLPPDHEVILSVGQLKSRDLRRIIHTAYGGDESMAMLTQVKF